MNKHTELLKKLAKLPSGERLQLRPRFAYKTDEWGMNRALVMESEGFTPIDDLKALATDYERLVKAAGDLVESFDQRRPDWWPNRFVALKKALEGK